MKDFVRKAWVKFFEERSRRERLQKTAISMVLIAAMVCATVYVAVTPAHTLEAEASLNCGKEEHVHDENCFTEQAELICGLEESAEEHTHTEECYGTTRVLTCTLEEHTHASQCYSYSQGTEIPEEEEGTVPETQPSEENGETEGTGTPEEETETEDEAEVEAEEEEVPEETEEAASGTEESVEYKVTLADGLVITMTGSGDAFPEGNLHMQAWELQEGDADYEAAFHLLEEETKDTAVLEQRIFNICLLDEDGNEVQPVKEVSVTFSRVLDGEEQGVQIHHLNTEENLAESIETFVDGNDVSMETGHFSYYGVTREGGNDDVAVIEGKQSYPSLAEAVKAVGNGDTIVLLDNISEDNIKVSKEVDFTIDVNGYTWTGDRYDMLTFSKDKVTVTLTGGREGEKGGTLQAGNGKRIITISSKNNCALNLVGLKLKGNGTKDNGGILYAVAPRNGVVNVAVTGCEFSGGNASGDGGAICFKGSNLTVQNCLFEGNKSVKGGAVYATSINTPMSVSFENCRFVKNEIGKTSYAVGGGAVTVIGNTSNPASLRIAGCTFTENTSEKDGGAVGFTGPHKTKLGTFTIIDSTFSKNRAEKNGGAVTIGSGITEISGKTTFLENTAGSGDGGGLYISGGSYKSSTNIQGTVFKGNQAVCGGAVGVNMGSGETLRLSDVTAEGNKAGKIGGAIYDYSGYANATLEIENSRILSNIAGYTAGGILSRSGVVRITGESVIKENAAKGESTGSDSDYKEIIGGVYLSAPTPSPSSFRIDKTVKIYKNQTQNEAVIPSGQPAEVYSPIAEIVSEAPDAGGKLEQNTVTDSGSKYVLKKYTKKGGSKNYFYYYNTVEEPERIYLDPAGANHSHKTGAHIETTLEGAVNYAKNTSAKDIYICSTVSVSPEDEEYLNTEEEITFTRCDQNRNYLFQVENGKAVTFTKTRINGALVDADCALVLVPGGTTLNIEGDTVIEAGKNVNTDKQFGGGGLRVSGTLNMSGGTIQKNQSAWSGGGIHALQAEINLTGGSILENEAGLLQKGDIDKEIDAEDEGAKDFLGYGDGGGIYMSGGTLSITKASGNSRTIIQSNKTASQGGGISLRSGTKARIYYGDISKNCSRMLNTQFASGGGINVYAGASLEMKNLYVTDNYQVKKPGGSESLGHCAVYSCPTGKMAIFETNGALIAENRKDSDILFIHQPNSKTIAYVSSHVLGGSKANWSEPDLWGRESSFRVSSKVDPAAKETAKAMAESDGVVMTGNWAYGYGTAIANNGTLVVGTEEMSLTVNKVWKDADGNVITDTSQNGEVPENLRVYLMKSLKGGAAEKVPEGEREDGEVKLNSGNEWSYTWERLGESEDVKWSVEEDKDDAAGFEAEISKQQLDTSWPDVVKKHYIITITNKEKREIDITVEKEWLDQDNANGWRPEEITAQLWRSDNAETPFKTQKLSEENGWSCTFEKLPKYDGAGTKYAYTVKEIPVENYTSEISEPQGGAQGTIYTITNTAYGKVQIKKTLDSYNETLGGAMFVFDVEAVLEGKVIFSDVFTADFKAPGTQLIDVGVFPAGTKITVEEVYSGGSYGLSGSDKKQTFTIEPNGDGTGVVNVLGEYLNTYHDKLIPGTGIRNHYESNGGSWTGSQAAD